MTVVGSAILVVGVLGAFEADKGGSRIRADVQSSIYTCVAAALLAASPSYFDPARPGRLH